MLTNAQIYCLTVWVVALALCLVVGQAGYQAGKRSRIKVVKTEIFSKAPVTQREADVARARAITADLIAWIKLKLETDVHTRKQADGWQYTIRQCIEVEHLLTSETEQRMNEKLRKT